MRLSLDSTLHSIKWIEKHSKSFHQFHLIHSINSIQGTKKYYKYTNYRTGKINIQLQGKIKSCNYREIYNYRAKSTIVVLHFEGKINLRWRGAVDDEGWTAASEEERCRLLLLMKRKSSAVDDGKEKRSLSACRCWWRLKRKPWAVEEIVAAVDEKEAAIVSTDDWSDD